jgi:hypothetical protein
MGRALAWPGKVDQQFQRNRYRTPANRIAAKIAEMALSMMLPPARTHCGDVDQSDFLVVLLWSGKTGDGHGQIRPAALQGCPGHAAGDILAHAGTGFHPLPRKLEQIALGIRGIDHEPAFQSTACMGIGHHAGAEQAAGAAFGCGNAQSGVTQQGAQPPYQRGDLVILDHALSPEAIAGPTFFRLCRFRIDPAQKEGTPPCSPKRCSADRRFPVKPRSEAGKREDITMNDQNRQQGDKNQSSGQFDREQGAGQTYRQQSEQGEQRGSGQQGQEQRGQQGQTGGQQKQDGGLGQQQDSQGGQGRQQGGGTSPGQQNQQGGSSSQTEGGRQQSDRNRFDD